jgi:uncharacterized protein YndB with AHSA1/START domain
VVGKEADSIGRGFGSLFEQESLARWAAPPASYPFRRDGGRHSGGKIMILRAWILFSAMLCAVLVLPGSAEEGDGSVRSEVLKTDAGELVLVQELVVNAPVARVWEAYSTSQGWMAWAAPLAEVDLRIGGEIRTHYGADAKIGDPGTNVLHIVNYVPGRVLTLQAELSERWPEVMKEDAGNLMNVIVFGAEGESETRIRSYGVGYRDLPEYDKLMEFFIPANEGLLQKLKEHLEKQPVQ